MKVLFLTREHIGLSSGGLTQQIIKTAKALREIGHDVIFADIWQNQIAEVDICHFFSTFNHMRYHFNFAVRQKVPIVFSPVFGDAHIPPWKHKAMVKTACLCPGFLTSWKDLNRMFNQSDRIIALTEMEKRRIRYIFNQPENKFSVIPNGLESDFSKAQPELFIKKYGVKDFVLNVGSIDPNKNQLNLIRAMKGLPHKLVIIGDAIMGHTEYEEQCRREAGDNVIFTGRINHADPLLASAYAAAKMFVLPSFTEVQPLVFGEAAQGGCIILTTNNVPPLPGLESYTFHFKASSAKQLRQMILQKFEQEYNGIEIKQAGIALMKWSNVAESISKIYFDLAQERRAFTVN